MGELMFSGFNSFIVPDGDVLRTKWNSVRNNLGTTMPPIKLVIDNITIFNRSVNRIVRYTPEPPGEDTWQVPEFTWSNARGDCEDYAILKYGVLLKSGMEHNDLRIVVGEIADLKGNRPHAWCAAYISGSWRVLDQMFDQLIHVADYINWQPTATMHDDVVLGWGKQIVMSEIMANKGI